MPASAQLPAETARLFASSDLERLWAAVRARLERNHVVATGTITVDDLSNEERHAVAGLLGRPIPGTKARVDLADLDDRLRESPAQRGLVGVIESLGGPVLDRKGRRADATADREERLAAARTATEEAGLAVESWCEPWLTSIRPVLARLPVDKAGAVVNQAVRALSLLHPFDAEPRTARNDLAVTLTGSAHGLDDGTHLAAVVLRAVALARGAEPPTTAAARRALWHDVGVTTDLVSSTVLTLGLRPLGGGARNAELRARSEDAVETHLNARDLARITWDIPADTVVYVCENPRVVEAAADCGAATPLVCTFGNPTVVVTDLLDRLHAAGARFRYHGDFDWPGISIANRVIGRVGATAWRMSVGDYEVALDGADGELPELEGVPVAASWDDELTIEMRSKGRAVHEELVLDALVSDLTGPAVRSPAERDVAL